MPLRLAAPMPPKNVSGTEMTSAQGQDTTRKLSARSPHMRQPPPVNSGGSTNSSSAIAHTTGV
jgi:hypothetical protein